MGKVLRRDELEMMAHTIKTKDGKIWANLHDGRFILRESTRWKKPVIRTSSNLYNQVDCVVSNELLVAKRDPESNILKHLDKPTVVKVLL